MLSIIVAVTVSLGAFSYAALVYKFPFAIPKTIAFLSIFHLLALILLYNFAGFNKAQANILASWKELLLLDTFFIYLIYKIQKGHAWKFNLCSIDVVLCIYLLFNIAYVFLSFHLSPIQTGIAAILNGLRIQVTMVIAYFTARMAIKKGMADSYKFLNFIVVVGTIASLFAIVEIIVNPIPFWNLFGLKKYLMDIAGLYEGEFTKGGVCLTYFASFDTATGSAIQWRRTGSLYFSPLSFAQVLLITIPTALILVINKKCSKKQLIIQLIALLSTISRGPIISIGISCFLLLISTPSIKLKSKIKLAVVFSFLLCIVIFKGIDYIKATVSLKDPSAASRASVYYSSAVFMLNHPFGAGLAASEQKFTEERIGGGESEYFENISRIGWLGFAIFFYMHVLILIKSKKGMKNINCDIFIISSIVFGITTSLFCQEFVNRIWRHSFLPFVYGWILGVWVTNIISAAKNMESGNARCI